jgi:predicted dehydrogenase
MAHPARVIVIGARTARQGIGEYVAGWFVRHGAQIPAIVGSTPETVAQARARLRERCAIECRGYTDPEAALGSEQHDIVAICTPYRMHEAQLFMVGRSGRHCLCEKPICWPVPAGNDPVALFAASGRFLDVLTQWPCTLPTFYALHPEQAGAVVERFEMRLSPITFGVDMVPDAVPHFLSMLRALVGATWPLNITAEFVEGDMHRLRITCDVINDTDCIHAILHLETCPQRPRTAWYAINGDRADREVELADYQQFFRSNDRRIPLPDPLGQLVGRFLADVADNRPTDQSALAHDQKLLTLFFDAVRVASSSANL